jgi:hypothetical protein
MTPARRVLVAALFVLSASVASAQTIIERHIVAQGSIGQPGREHAFLVLVNDEQIHLNVIIKYTTDAGQAVFSSHSLLGESRKTIKVATDAPGLGTATHFAVTLYFSDPDPLADISDTLAVVARMVWHRASDGREVDSQPAEVRRAKKR